MFSPGCKGGRIYSTSTVIYFGLRLPGKGNSLTPKELGEQRKASGRGWRWKPASQSLWDSERYRHTLPASPLSNLEHRLLWWADSSVGIRDVNCPLCIWLITHFYFTNTSIYDSLDLEKQKTPLRYHILFEKHCFSGPWPWPRVPVMEIEHWRFWVV